MLKIFQAVGPKGPSWTVKTLMGPITTKSREELDTRISELRAKAKGILGRDLTDDEFTDGPPKPKPTKEQERERRHQQVREERAKRLEQEANFSPEAQRLATAKARAEEERRAGLSAAARELEDATREAQAAEQRREDQQRRAETKATAAYRTLREGIDDSLLVALLDSSVTQEAVDALKRESEALDKTADIATVRSNVAVIQRAIAGEVELRDADLKAAVDRAELRRRMLASGQTWDAIDTAMVGDQVFIALTVGDRTVKISESKFNSRTSDESLKDELFGEVTNV